MSHPPLPPPPENSAGKPSLPPLPENSAGKPSLPPLPENSAGKPSLPPLPKPMPQLPQSLEMLESVAFAAICSCVVTNRLLMKKGLITSAEYAADLDENAKIMKETILFDRSTLNFDETIRLLKGASQSE